MKAHEAFVAAFAHFVRSGGHGAQDGVLEQGPAQPLTLKPLIHAKAGQRRAWLDFQERIAEHY